MQKLSKILLAIILPLSFAWAEDYKSMLENLASKSQESSFEAEQTVFSFKEEAVFSSFDAAKEGTNAAGTIMPWAEVTVVEAKEDMLHVKMSAWQQGDVNRVLYASAGKRIFTLTLKADELKSAVILSDKQEDKETGQAWSKAEVSFWVAAKAFTEDKETLVAIGQDMYGACATCHGQAHTPDHHTANLWPNIVKSMQRFVPFDKTETRFFTIYNQMYSKDMVN